MFKSIKHITSAVTDLTAIAGKEATFQVTRSCNCVTDMTGAIANGASHLRKGYEAKLARRKAKGKALMLDYVQEVRGE
ncbi:MAG: hypothetical protein C0617_11080 [Desulfuromonas sp.]|uniref:hypothetical protein n=1 Tax=Desulfuromonas sp. TaxID=892 RepID=UPI000CBB7719|nr:hypothetical protein [Desulfuromonas sp.]PLX83669.1 MAG: hypothetical protein C0617_11080 [Desulfuromonas sp.]